VHGASVVRAERIMHGKVSPVLHDGSGPFAGLPSPLLATRYHSLLVEEATLPPFLVATARTPEGELMAVRHATLPIWGVQFHPESILTEYGHEMLRAFLAAGRGGVAP
jgi:anthranilate synthase/aminodeoxychorismate synthase-like glutamine amidotransferase